MKNKKNHSHRVPVGESSNLKNSTLIDIIYYNFLILIKSIDFCSRFEYTINIAFELLKLTQTLAVVLPIYGKLRDQGLSYKRLMKI